jgi:hypothetical protein
MNELKNRYIIICEGSKSEVAYIQKLNKYFREQNINITLIPKAVETGHYTAVIKKYRYEFKKNKKCNFIIWVDKDIYQRNNQKNLNKYTKKPHNVPDFCFNIFNFEDFLILHYPKDSVLQHQKRCEHENHFENPLDSKKYMPLIKEVIPGYNKSSLPKKFYNFKRNFGQYFY